MADAIGDTFPQLDWRNCVVAEIGAAEATLQQRAMAIGSRLLIAEFDVDRGVVTARRS